MSGPGQPPQALLGLLEFERERLTPEHGPAGTWK